MLCPEEKVFRPIENLDFSTRKSWKINGKFYGVKFSS